jgi:spore maturation protein CgeB
MRLLRISSPDCAWWKQVYKQHPGLDNASYDEQRRVLDYDAYAQSDSYTYYLSKLGYESAEVYSNITFLQHAWARENNTLWKPKGFERALALAQAISFKPDILFLNDTVTFDHAWIRELKSKCKTLRLVVGWCASSSWSISTLRCYDIILSSSYPMVTEFRDLGLRAELLHHAFDPRILSRIHAAASPTIDVTFIGRVLMEKGFHLERAQFLEELSRVIHLEVYTPEGGLSFLGRIRALARTPAYQCVNVLRKLGVHDRVIGQIPEIRKALTWTEPPPRFNLSRVMNPAAYGLAMYELLSRSNVTLNMHAGFASSWTGNMRLFEATGIGTCLVTDWKENISQIFSPDSEVITYKSSQECIEKVQWLLNNPGQRKEIASAGQRRTLRDHTYANRVDELDSLFRNHFQGN